VLGVGENYLTSLVVSLFLVAIHQVAGRFKRTRTLNMGLFMVKRTSHTQKVPHIGFPQKPPIIKVNNVNKAPLLALVLENN